MPGALGRLRGVVAAAGLAALSASLAGCGGGVEGVELNGKIFDALGVSGDTWGKKDEPKTQARAPLVLPPDTTRLPEPGAAPTAAPLATGSIDPAWPKDREAQKISAAQAKKKAQDQHCQDGNWKQKAHKDEIAAAQGPEGTCSGSLFSVFSKSILGNQE